MPWGKCILSAALAATLCATTLLAGEAAPPYPSSPPYAAASLRKNATVAVGGEIKLDYAFRTSTSSPKTRDSRTADLALRGMNLRILADVHPNVKAILKFDFSRPDSLGNGNGDNGAADEILEEAMLVMSAVGGTGIGFFAGKGQAPYGQDVTLGMLQSYHHAADREDSSEGRIFITDPPDDAAGAGGKAYPPMRPGQVDRVLAAGLKYEWTDRWKVELAVFQPNRERYESRLQSWDGDGAAGIGGAARAWWMPFEDFVLQASVITIRSGRMGKELAKAVSAGFNYRRGAWQLFGEYQRGLDWNFTENYNTDTWQLGAAYTINEYWRIGAAAEGLHIRDDGVRTAYLRGALNIRHTFESGLFLLAEYGYERRRAAGDKTFGHFAGMRLGFSF